MPVRLFPALLLFTLMSCVPLLSIAAEPAALSDVIAGKVVPLALKARELTADWQCITVEKQSSATDMLGTIAAMSAGKMANPASIYYTQGKIAGCGDVNYLIAYQSANAGAGMSAILQQVMAGGFRDNEDHDAMLAKLQPGPPSPEDTLVLCLLNMKEMSAISNIHVFDAKKDLMSEEMKKAAEERQRQEKQKGLLTTSISNLRQLATAVQMYVQDNDGIYPPMQTPEKMKDALITYLGSEKMFINPLDNQPYLPNAILAGKKEAHITNPTTMAAVYEATPAFDGTRGVGFCDGHAKRVTEEKWQRVKKASKIP